MTLNITFYLIFMAQRVGPSTRFRLVITLPIHGCLRWSLMAVQSTLTKKGSVALISDKMP